MNKRKADIFTVVESVPNWFEADSYTVASTERGDRVVANQLGCIVEGSVPFNAAHYEQADPTASRARDNHPTWLTATGTGDLADRLGEGPKDQGPVEAATSAGTGPVNQRPGDSANGNQLGQLSREPTGWFDRGELSTAGPTVEQVADDMAGGGGLTQHPFWALLMAAGYEEI